MHAALLHLHLPLALNGEVESTEGVGNGGLGAGVITVGSIVIVWLGLFALWWFVFRDKRRSRRNEREDPPER